MSRNSLQLDFAPRARRGMPRLGMGMLLVSVVALAAVSYLAAQRASGNARQAETLAAVEARRGATVASANRPLPPDPGEQARVRAAQQAAGRLATPWADLIGSLESAHGPAVALLAVEPSVARRSLRLTAEARSAADMMDYVSGLQRDVRLSRVVLVSHELQAKAPGTPMRFQVQAAWGEGP